MEVAGFVGHRELTVRVEFLLTVCPGNVCLALSRAFRVRVVAEADVTTLDSTTTLCVFVVDSVLVLTLVCVLTAVLVLTLTEVTVLVSGLLTTVWVEVLVVDCVVVSTLVSVVGKTNRVSVSVSVSYSVW